MGRVSGVGAVQARNIYTYIFIIPTLLHKPNAVTRSRIQCNGMTCLSGRDGVWVRVEKRVRSAPSVVSSFCPALQLYTNRKSCITF